MVTPSTVSAVYPPALDASVVAARRPRGRPRKTAQERDDGNRRQALISAAARLFREKGFAATSTRDIAAAVGMHSGSPFYHFRSKEALLYAVMEAGMHAALARQATALQTEPGARAAQRLRHLIRAHFETLLGPGNDFIPVMLFESRTLKPGPRAALGELQAAYEAAWMPVLHDLQCDGHLGAPVHLSRLLILGALNWSVQWFDPRGAATLDELTDAALRLFLKDVS
jgi:TetR/AcrR family transcriptional regulator, cholesterol catabolism regulator